FIDNQVLAVRNQVLAHRPRLLIGDDHFLPALRGRPQFHDPGDFGNDRRDARTASFEKLHDTRKSTGDVFGLRDFLWDFGDDVAFTYFIAIFDVQIGINREGIAGHALAALHDRHLRVQALGAVLNDHTLGESRHLILLLVDGDSLNNVFEFYRAFVFADDGHGMRIPLGKHGAFHYRFTFGDFQARAVGQAIMVPFLAAFLTHKNFSVPAYNDLLVILIF